MAGKLLLPALLVVSLGLGFCIGGMGQRSLSRAEPPVGTASALTR